MLSALRRSWGDVRTAETLQVLYASLALQHCIRGEGGKHVEFLASGPSHEFAAEGAPIYLQYCFRQPSENNPPDFFMLQFMGSESTLFLTAVVVWRYANLHRNS